MKKLLCIVFSIVVTSVLLYSCKKNETEVLSEDQAAANLVESDQFIEFSKRFIPDFLRIASYHSQIKKQGKDRDFISLVSVADNDDRKLEDAYSRVSLDYAKAISLRNQVDNDILSLFHQHPFLLNFNETQIRKIMVKAMEMGLFSDDPKWLEAKREINLQLKTSGAQTISGIKRVTNSVGTNLVSTDSGLTLDEIWGCIKEAVGIGSASILGIAGLRELAKDGIQAAVITVSKWLAKKAGWVGAIIVAVDFGSCIYKESFD